MTRLAGERATVVRPHAQWQLYERRREWYGRVWDWYTVEGPFVREHDGRYYCFYSGGAWKEPNYGVSYAVADHPMEPFVSTPGADGPNLLRTRPGQVIGPGHASVVHAPDNAHEYIVYHAWDPQHTKRLMRIDRLDWSVEGPSSPVPTLDPQPAPPLPSFNDLFDGPDEAPPNPDTWRVDGGDWRQRDGELVQQDSARSDVANVFCGRNRPPVRPGTRYPRIQPAYEPENPRLRFQDRRLSPAAGELTGRQGGGVGGRGACGIGDRGADG
jgi:hypothetical protein